MKFAKAVTIKGYRGFRSETTVNFAVPSGPPASGLTLLTGPNNSGKTSVLEVLRVLGSRNQPSFSRAQRNARSRKVRVSYTFESGENAILESVSQMSHATTWTPGPHAPLRDKVYYIPASREVAPWFGLNLTSRRDYTSQTAEFRAKRNESVDLNGLLMTIEADSALKNRFDEDVTRLIGFSVKWGIEKIENDQFVFSIASPTGSHTSDGIGYGVLSVFYVVAALMDTSESSIVLIDEPETSMHPQVQRRVADYLAQKAADTQVVVSTHSPYFVNPSWFPEGAEVLRCYIDDRTTKVGRLTAVTKDKLLKLASDLHNPHVFGLDAREIFFATGHRRVLVAEGQEDALALKSILSRPEVTTDFEIFGWGAGGAEKIELIIQMLQDLGISNIATLVDGDKSELHAKLKVAYPSLKHGILPTEDIRDKNARKPVKAKTGVVNSSGTLKPEYEVAVLNLLAELGD